MRSLNNLLERFHQSFFFYLLPSPTRYVSIGVYMPPFMVMSCGLVLSAVSLWLQSGDWLHFPDASKFAQGRHTRILAVSRCISRPLLTCLFSFSISV